MIKKNKGEIIAELSFKGSTVKEFAEKTGYSKRNVTPNKNSLLDKIVGTERDSREAVYKINIEKLYTKILENKEINDFLIPLLIYFKDNDSATIQEVYNFFKREGVIAHKDKIRRFLNLMTIEGEKITKPVMKSFLYYKENGKKKVYIKDEERYKDMIRGWINLSLGNLPIETSEQQKKEAMIELEKIFFSL